MEKLSGAERIFTTLRHQEPDRVPHFELGIHSAVAEKIYPNSRYTDLVEYLDIDAVITHDAILPGNVIERIDSSHHRDQWGVVWRISPEGGHNVGAPIKSEEDLDKFRVPDPDESWRYEPLVEFTKKYKGQRAIIAGFQDPFHIANSMRGAEEHFKDFIRNPAFIDRISKILQDYYLRYVRNCIQAGAEIIFITGDYATTKFPMVSREQFTKRVIPVLKALVDEAKSHGAYVFKHTDGNIMPIMDLIVGAGIDGLHPIDPNAGMDLGEVKKKYGDKITLLGNVDCAYTLTWGTLEDVRKDVQRCIRQAARGGGYICNSSNSIHSAVKPENYVEMVKAIHEYGKYPISI